MATAFVKHRQTSSEFRVSVAVEDASEFVMHVRDGAINLKVQDNAIVFDGLKQAVDSACLSGAAYARRALDLTTPKIEVLEATGHCGPGEIEGFAIASMCAVATALGMEDRLSFLVSEEWEVVECQRSEGGS